MSDQNINVKVLVADDEPLSLFAIKHSVNAKEGWQVIAEASNGNQVIESLIDHKLDVLFLDVNMPNMNGIEVAEKLMHAIHAPLVVFVTAYEQYALPAFKVNAAGYLMKPFDEVEFEDLISRLEKRLFHRKACLTGIATSQSSQWLQVKQSNVSFMIPINKIIKSVSSRNYMLIYTMEGEYTLRSSVTEFMELVSEYNFIRVHRSVVLNLEYINLLVQSGSAGWSLQLKNGSQIPISQSFLADVTKILKLPMS
ncbi:MAG: LytTR family DNA-binding domain-containing protein [Marinicella sp.]|nr:response regulator transcription factor [Xanthomonadales bacterium]